MATRSQPGGAAKKTAARKAAPKKVAPKPAGTKPAASKPAPSKPAPSKPAAAKPAAAKQVAARAAAPAAGRGDRPVEERLRRGLTLAERRRQRRDDLLAAALELFGTKGYAATSIDELCRAAYVSTRNFYEEFSGREAVLDALLGQIAAEVFEAVTATTRPPGAADLVQSEVASRVEAVVRVLLTDPRKARLALIEAPVASPDKAAWLREYHRVLVEYLRELFREVVSEIDANLAGSLEDWVNPTTQYYLAQAVVGSVSQILIDWVVRDDPPPVEEAIHHAVFAVLRLVSLRGLPEMLARAKGAPPLRRGDFGRG